jgi:hypothetical protein
LKFGEHRDLEQGNVAAQYQYLETQAATLKKYNAYKLTIGFAALLA